VKNGGLGIPYMEDEYAAYKIHHMATLLSTFDEQEILDGLPKHREKGGETSKPNWFPRGCFESPKH
jgi:hypothetical protein